MDRLRSVINKNKNMTGALLFASFMLIQFIILRLANQAGRGYLETEKQEYVYLFLQIIVIAGFLLHALFFSRMKKRMNYLRLVAAVLGVSAVGAVIMLFAYEGSPFYLAVTGLTVLCLGSVIGAVYLKLSGMIRGGAKAGVCVGVGYACAVALQYVFQLQWTVKPVLSVLLLISFAVMALIFLCGRTEDRSQTDPTGQGVTRSKLVFSVVITVAMLVFTTYYNSYIHHLQIASGYNDYNVYSWPRLMMIPLMLLFGLIGDIRNGRFLPISALCVVVIALLNTALLSRETYLLNMCLYYISFSAAVAYYHLIFLRLAPRTKHPVIWAAMGRVIDSLLVVISFALRFSRFSMITVLVIDIAALAVTVVFMAVNGDFSFNAPAAAIKAVAPGSGSTVDPFFAVQQEYGISPSEMRVLRELVMTDDKQDAMAARLGISVSTFRHHVTSIYKKTGTQSRLALSNLITSYR